MNPVTDQKQATSTAADEQVKQDGDQAKAARKATKQAAKPTQAPKPGKKAKQAKQSNPGKGAKATKKAARKATSTKQATKQAASTASERSNKKPEVIAMMQRAKGPTLAEIMDATGWQRHTVRGFVSILGSKGKHSIESSKNAAGERTYKIAK